MELDLYCLPDDSFHASRSRCQDPGVPNLDTTTHVDAVFGYGWFIRMIQLGVLVIVLHHGLNWTPYLCNIDVTTFAGDAVDTRFFRAKVFILEDWREPVTFLGGSLVLISNHVITQLMQLKIGPTKCKKTTDVDSPPVCPPAKWIGRTINLHITVAVLFEHATKEFQVP